ncbi:MAG: hypothetical protein AAF411_03520 [Myxococcota bacterium]
MLRTYLSAAALLAMCPLLFGAHCGPHPAERAFDPNDPSQRPMSGIEVVNGFHEEVYISSVFAIDGPHGQHRFIESALPDGLSALALAEEVSYTPIRSGEGIYLEVLNEGRHFVFVRTASRIFGVGFQGGPGQSNAKIRVALGTGRAPEVVSDGGAFVAIGRHDWQSADALPGCLAPSFLEARDALYYGGAESAWQVIEVNAADGGCETITLRFQEDSARTRQPEHPETTFPYCDPDGAWPFSPGEQLRWENDRFTSESGAWVQVVLNWERYAFAASGSFCVAERDGCIGLVHRLTASKQETDERPDETRSFVHEAIQVAAISCPSTPLIASSPNQAPTVRLERALDMPGTTRFTAIRVHLPAATSASRAARGEADERSNTVSSEQTGADSANADAPDLERPARRPRPPAACYCEGDGSGEPQTAGCERTCLCRTQCADERISYTSFPGPHYWCMDACMNE